MFQIIVEKNGDDYKLIISDGENTREIEVSSGEFADINRFFRNVSNNESYTYYIEKRSTNFFYDKESKNLFIDVFEFNGDHLRFEETKNPEDVAKNFTDQYENFFPRRERRRRDDDSSRREYRERGNFETKDDGRRRDTENDEQPRDTRRHSPFRRTGTSSDKDEIRRTENEEDKLEKIKNALNRRRTATRKTENEEELIRQDKIKERIREEEEKERIKEEEKERIRKEKERNEDEGKNRNRNGGRRTLSDILNTGSRRESSRRRDVPRNNIFLENKELNKKRIIDLLEDDQIRSCKYGIEINRDFDFKVVEIVGKQYLRLFDDVTIPDHLDEFPNSVLLDLFLTKAVILLSESEGVKLKWIKPENLNDEYEIEEYYYKISENIFKLKYVSVQESRLLMKQNCDFYGIKMNIPSLNSVNSSDKPFFLNNDEDENQVNIIRDEPDISMFKNYKICVPRINFLKRGENYNQEELRIKDFFNIQNNLQEIEHEDNIANNENNENENNNDDNDQYLYKYDDEGEFFEDDDFDNEEYS